MLDPNERLRHLVEQLNDAVYTVDVATNQFTSLNLAASRLTGYTQEELVGGSIGSIIAPESMPTVRKMIQRKLKKDTSTVYEIELVQKSGRRVPVEISSRIIYKNGKPREILGIARDITERKYAEQQREIFLSLITHEIKNPLTSIQMYTQLLKKRAGERRDEKDAQMLSLMQEQITSINQLLSDFIEVNQLQLKKFSIQKSQVSLDEAVDEVVRSFQRIAHGHKIEKTGKISENVLADKQRLCQVLTNLVSNAIKYSPEKSTIEIRLGTVKENAVIQVIDHGIGIPKNEQKAIFDLFYRVKDGTSGIKGHGLGLFICQQIMKSHKGKLWVESEVGKGSTFSFSLPFT